MLFVTGGLGYIGSHFVVSALQAGHDVLVLDNLSNSHADVQAKIEMICQRSFICVHGDVRDAALLNRLFGEHDIKAVVHFAGLKSVAESVANPLSYYDNNVHGSQILLQAMLKHGVYRLIFSSSATVYGEPHYLPYDEQHPTNPVNPYGHSKRHVEQMLADVCVAHPNFTAISLRYFNPIGAHSSGLIGENPKDIPNNLMPYVLKVAKGELPYLQIFGDDYDTKDGTGERDYIDIMDLVAGHMAAMAYLANTGHHVFNLGTGKGTTVLELVSAFELANDLSINKKVVARRDGDLAKFWASVDKANILLNWTAKNSINTSCVMAFGVLADLKR